MLFPKISQVILIQPFGVSALLFGSTDGRNEQLDRNLSRILCDYKKDNKNNNYSKQGQNYRAFV